MPSAKKKSINFWSIITSIVALTGGGIFVIYDRVNASIDKRIETIAERKILACPQIQKVDTIYRMLETNFEQHAEINRGVQKLNTMIVFMNSSNPKFVEYMAAQNAPELIGPHRNRGTR
jgi:hypothetical protein